MITARSDRTNSTIEFDGQVIRMTTGRYKHEVPITFVLSVEFREPGRVLAGSLHIQVPGGVPERGALDKPKDGTVYFARSDTEAFRAVSNAVTQAYRETRQMAVQLARVLAVDAEPVPTTTETPGLTVARAVAIGDVTRQFDSRSVGLLTGVLRHDLWVHGSAVGVRIGRLGLGLGRVGLAGRS